MKREAVFHSKMKRLCRRLDLPLWQGVGLMESIWHLTAREAPRGDIGKLTNEDIALGIDYRGNEDELIDALVTSGWIERSDQFRLIIHHWHDHADDSVHMRLARGAEYFSTGEKPSLVRLPQKDRERALGRYGVRTASAQNGHLCTIPVPVPEPIPEPEPTNTSVPESAALNKPASPDPVREWFYAQFWPIYPRQKSPDAALKEARVYAVTPEIRQKMIDALRMQIPGLMSRPPDKRPYPAKWFSSGAWKDEPDLPQTRGPNISDRNQRRRDEGLAIAMELRRR